jgi:hypothetical protein
MRSDAQPSLLGCEVELERNGPFHDEWTETSTRAFLEETTATITDHERVSQCGIEDARNGRFLRSVATETARAHCAPLRITARTHECAIAAALAKRDIGSTAAAGTHHSAPRLPHARRADAIARAPEYRVTNHDRRLARKALALITRNAIARDPSTHDVFDVVLAIHELAPLIVRYQTRNFECFEHTKKTRRQVTARHHHAQRIVCHESTGNAAARFVYV